MGDKDDQNTPETWLEDLSNYSSVESYETEEMIVCAKCARSNPPNRLDCMYCGDKLRLSDEQSRTLKPVLRKTDTWKNAYNVIFVSKLSSWDDVHLEEVAKMTRLAPDSLRDLLAREKSAPIARSEQEEEIEIVTKRLEELGLETKLFLDDQFQLESPARRLRQINFADNILELTLFNSGEIKKIAVDDLSLIVTGALFERRVESSEKHSRKKENKILETAETNVDEMLIDIFTKTDPIGYRISAKGFDFSCLGETKSLIANENMNRLVAKLREFAPDAKFDEDYLRLRGFLSGVWEVDEKVDSKGLKRKGLGFGGYKRETVTTTHNLAQFTKYSRLAWHLHETEK